MVEYNGVMLQSFHWYTTPEDQLWRLVADSAATLAQAGFTAIWLPPAGKGRDGQEHEIWIASHQWLIDTFLHVRKNNAFGAQYDYFDHPNCVGWTRTGDEQHPGGMAVILSNGEAGVKAMQTASPDTTYTDRTEHVDDPVTTNSDGWGEFRCLAGSVSVWVPATA